ncbi:unnamed protein product, partial [Rotaria sordida]
MPKIKMTLSLQELRERQKVLYQAAAAVSYYMTDSSVDFDGIQYELDMPDVFASFRGIIFLHVWFLYLFVIFNEIVMEYCGAGSMSDIMKLSGRTLNYHEAAIILKYILKRLEYLHLCSKIHRDIKAGNILLTNDDHTKLADFEYNGQTKHNERNIIL